MPVPSRDTGKSGDFKKLPPGIHAACCDQVIGLGLQKSMWSGEEKVQPKVYLRFEVPQERVQYEKDGKKVDRPMSIGITLTNSLSPKATLRKFLESWRGVEFTAEELKSFDLMKVLGAPCMITVEHNEKPDRTYANIKAITRFFPEMVVAGQRVAVPRPVAEMELLAYDPDYEPAQFEKLPDWIKKILEARVHPQQQAASETGANPADDFRDDDISDVPF